MAELATVSRDFIPGHIPLIPWNPHTGPRLTVRAWVGKSWGYRLIPHVSIYRGYKGLEPVDESWKGPTYHRWESCWKVDLSWLGWAFEAMPCYQGRLIDHWH